MNSLPLSARDRPSPNIQTQQRFQQNKKANFPTGEKKNKENLHFQLHSALIQNSSTAISCPNQILALQQQDELINKLQKDCKQALIHLTGIDDQVECVENSQKLVENEIQQLQNESEDFKLQMVKLQEDIDKAIKCYEQQKLSIAEIISEQSHFKLVILTKLDELSSQINEIRNCDSQFANSLLYDE